MENPFLQKKFPDLQTSTEVSSAVRKKERMTEKRVPNEPGERIGAYLERLESIFANPDKEKRERGVRLLTHMIHETYVVKPEDVPESTFKLQQRIAREQGHGNIEIAPEMRSEMIRTIRKDQTQSLDTWLNYLGSPDDKGAYPTWFRYFAFRSVLKMSSYDKEKHAFSKRTKATTTLFPDLNREALAYVCDALVKTHEKKEPVEGDESFQKLLQRANFADLYAHAIEKVTPASKEQKETIEGEWRTFKQGSDATPLWKSLQGHGTGWCTAGESTAEAQLNAGDFHVFYSKDGKGGFTVPRIAIRMEQGEIAEVRGIKDNAQGLEDKLLDTADVKTKSLPGHEAYLKKFSDMKRMTEIEKKSDAGRDLDKEELRFLYELDATIEGFAHRKDSRVEELRSKRQRRADLAIIFGCTLEELERKEQFVLNDVPTFTEIPSDKVFKNKVKGFGFDWTWEKQYRENRPLTDFALNEEDLDQIGVGSARRVSVLKAMEAGRTEKEQPRAKIFDIGDLIRRKRQEDPSQPEYLTTKEVLEAIDDAGYRPATIEELLAYARDFWKPEPENSERPLSNEEKMLQHVNAEVIHAFGSLFSDSAGERDVPCLSWGGSARGLGADDFVRVYGDTNHFLVIHKETS
ncbi:MAG: hypothetical protein V1745_04420 [Patescibacteria group bacterium]